MKRIFGFCLAIASISFASCNKENSEPPGSNIQGNWTVISMHIKTNSIIEVINGNDDIKSVTTSEYDTKDNTGDVVIDADKMSYTNLAYTMDAVAHSTQYENGTESGTNDFPLTATITAQSGSAPYEIIGADSIYFSQGFFVSGNNSQDTKPGGGKIRLEGDKLYLTQSVHETSTDDNQGAAMTNTADATIVVTFQRK